MNRIPDQATSSVQKFPGYFTVQIHPEEDYLVSNLAKISAQFAKTNPQEQQLKELLNQSIYPEDKIGYICALKYIEDHLLTQNFTQLTEKAFLLEIKKINWLVVQNQYGRGEYRSGNCMIWNDEIMPKLEDRNAKNFSNIDSYILKDCTEEQKKLWRETRKKIWAVAFTKNRAPQSITFSEKEKNLLKGLAGFPPEFSEVASLMNQFAQTFFHKIKEEEDMFTLMAWVHQKLIEIHPFVDGNGRTARLVMNLIRMWNGKNPLLITDNSSYNASACALEPNQFADYLRALETKQMKINDLFDQVLRSRFENDCQQVDWSIVKTEFKRLY